LNFTSFSLNGKRFKEFGEGDRPVADTELLMLLVACLGILLLYCIPCLYAFSALRNSFSPYKASPCRTRLSAFMDMPASLTAPADDTRKHPRVWAEAKRPASRRAAMDSRAASISGGELCRGNLKSELVRGFLVFGGLV
jgi:hypothetical protein